MKTRSPLKPLIIAPLMAVAMTFGALTPLATAQADPVNPDHDVVAEVTADIDAEAEELLGAEITDGVMNADNDTAVDETPTTDAQAQANKGSPLDADTAKDSVADVDNPAVPNAQTRKTINDATEPHTRSGMDVAVPLTAEAAAVVEARELAPLRLRKSNGVWVTVTPQMQANALVVINTIQSANWSGVTAAEKNRLVVIALMTMAQESTFYTHPSAHRPDRNHDVGPFQQRSLVGWYADGATQAENIKTLNNIPYATRTFIEGHRVPKYVKGGAGPTGYIIPGVFQMKNWRTDAQWEVAANVQRPARQYRYHYEYWRPVVEGMVTALKGQSTSTPDVYITAGDHSVAGRQWRTTCEAYSKTIRRCRANIWATTVSRVNGKFVQKNGWQFNNLTYLPSKRAQWKGNPLAKTGTFTSGGRSWRTSCADSWTGPKACRSFMQVNVIESYVDGAGNRQFRDVKKEVFNNVVRFSD